MKSTTFTHLDLLTHDEIQKIISYVSSSLDFSDADISSYNVLVPDTFEVSSSYFSTQGHELESKIIQKWPQLNGIKARHGDDYLKNYMLDNVITEYPQFIAQELKELFEQFE